MPQIFQVLRCYKCLVFQVHQTRKDNKWTCKICGEKQSVKRHYGIGNSQECRTHVQKLNKLRGEKEETSTKIEYSEDSDNNEDIQNIATENVNEKKISNNISKESKWSKFLDEGDQNKNKSEPENLNYIEVVHEIPCKKKFNTKFRQKNCLINSIGNFKNSNIKMNSPKENELVGVFCTNVYNSNANNVDSELQKVSYKTIGKSQIDIDNKSQNKSLYPLSQKVNKGSKWVQFTDYEIPDVNDDKNTEKNCSKHPLFSLCDDNEIDSILEL